MSDKLVVPYAPEHPIVPAMSRGTVVREGVTYNGDGEVVSWCVRYSVGGRVDQFDMVVNGRVWRRGGARKVREWMGVRV